MAFTSQEHRTFFVTTVTWGRRSLFQVERNAHLMLEIFRSDRQKQRYQLHAFVLMPDHLHLLLTPGPEISLEKSVQYIKGGFSFRLKTAREVWQRGFTEHRIQDAKITRTTSRISEKIPFVRDWRQPQTCIHIHLVLFPARSIRRLRIFPNTGVEAPLSASKSRQQWVEAWGFSPTIG